MRFIFEIILSVGFFVFGIYFGRKNPNKVNVVASVVSDIKKA